MSSGKDRQGMVQIFEYIEYDLDTHRITDFRLKPWADTFLVLRTALYETENPNRSQDKREGENPDGEALSDTTVLCPWGESNPRPFA